MTASPQRRPPRPLGERANRYRKDRPMWRRALGVIGDVLFDGVSGQSTYERNWRGETHKEESERKNREHAGRDYLDRHDSGRPT